jgi:hypothetical protein
MKRVNCFLSLMLQDEYGYFSFALILNYEKRLIVLSLSCRKILGWGVIEG